MENGCKERSDFTERFWYYYKMLEEDCAGLQKYVRFCNENMGTSSDEIIKQLLAVSAEFDNVCKEMTGLGGRLEIKDYKDWIVANTDFNTITEAVIVLKREKIELRPFSDWEHSCTMLWWSGHNHVKHERKTHYFDGNLYNLLNAMAALYFLECLQFKRIANSYPTGDDKNFDVPPDVSELFYLKNFQTNFSVIGRNLIVKTK